MPSPSFGFRFVFFKYFTFTHLLHRLRIDFINTLHTLFSVFMFNIITFNIMFRSVAHFSSVFTAKPNLIILLKKKTCRRAFSIHRMCKCVKTFSFLTSVNKHLRLLMVCIFVLSIIYLFFNINLYLIYIFSFPRCCYRTCTYI